MRIIRGIHHVNHLKTGGVLTIGHFDGVHLGHQALLKALIIKAKKHHTQAMIIIFEPEKSQSTLYHDLSMRLSSFREKMKKLAEWGVDVVIYQPLCASFKKLTANAFIQDILIKKLAIKALIIGDDFRFGCNRAGDYDLLMQFHRLGYFIVHRVASILYQKKRISSTQIRTLLRQHHFQSIPPLLGRPYTLTARVVTGQKMGQALLNIPTANLHIKVSNLSFQGVFIAHAYYASTKYEAIVNIGVCPTIKTEKKMSVEAYLFDFKGNLYHHEITLEFLLYLRDEKQFQSIEALKKAISKDIQDVKHYFQAINNPIEKCT
ncbi:MAG: riboflavin biosynthesis protein RibF [Endozoicomonadaceae bacterium]|nr:riboflavin biosynthesis protein RibF [Endozoicomonadaceae bacterium]